MSNFRPLHLLARVVLEPHVPAVTNTVSLVVNNTVIIGFTTGNVYGLDEDTRAHSWLGVAPDHRFGNIALAPTDTTMRPRTH